MTKADVNRPVTTTQTSLDILVRLKDDPGRTLDELDADLDVARSTIHRHLLTLEENNFVVREQSRFYLGLRFLDFGVRARDRVAFFDTAQDHVDRLAEDTGEKIWLVAKEGHFSVHLYKATGESPLQTSARLGQRRHLHQLAAGKAILANLPEAELAEIVDAEGLNPVTPATITDEDALREELEEIREVGYAFNIGESIEGLNAVGAPICDQEGYPIGGISISGPANRVKGEYLRTDLKDKLLAAVDEIQINLRYGDGA